MNKKSKGMTLVELLIAMGLSVMIMAATFTIVRFSSNTYDVTAKMINENNRTYDAVNIINRNIRSAYYCTTIGDDNTLACYVDGSVVGGEEPVRQIAKNAGEEGSVIMLQFTFDDEQRKMFLMDNNWNETVVSSDIDRIDWKITMNGVQYAAYRNKSNGDEELAFFGYAYMRGR